jgi:hypothetical protein
MFYGSQMSVWHRVKSAANLWMNDPRLAEGARYKSRLMGPTMVVVALVTAILGSWGLAALCLVVGLLMTAHGLTGRRDIAP